MADAESVRHYFHHHKIQFKYKRQKLVKFHKLEKE